MDGYRYIDITNDYMFSYVMRDPTICSRLLEQLLPGQRIRKLVYYDTSEDVLRPKVVEPSTQMALQGAADKRGVRLDVYLDDGETVYNVEMQTANLGTLPQRSRMYQSHMTVHQLSKGASFLELRPCYVIFICKFDPFGQGRYCYTFENRSAEDAELKLNDGAYTLFFNTAGREGNIPPRLRELLTYLNDTARFPVAESENPLIHSIQNAVDLANQSDEWRRSYMVYEAKIQDWRMEGRVEGRAEGRMEDARRMLEDRLPLNQIARYTALPMEDLQKLQKEMKSY